MTRESVSPATKFLECLRRLPALILRDTTVWASASSSCAKRSEFWDIASTSLQLPVAVPAFPFLRAKSKESRTKSTERSIELGSWWFDVAVERILRWEFITVTAPHSVACNRSSPMPIQRLLGNDQRRPHKIQKSGLMSI